MVYSDGAACRESLQKIKCTTQVLNRVYKVRVHGDKVVGPTPAKPRRITLLRMRGPWPGSACAERLFAFRL